MYAMLSKVCQSTGKHLNHVQLSELNDLPDKLSSSSTSTLLDFESMSITTKLSSQALVFYHWPL